MNKANFLALALTAPLLGSCIYSQIRPTKIMPELISSFTHRIEGGEVYFVFEGACDPVYYTIDRRIYRETLEENEALREELFANPKRLLEAIISTYFNSDGRINKIDLGLLVFEENQDKLKSYLAKAD